MSDNKYDGFDYKSSQDSSDIDYQIDLFEFHQYFKSKRNIQKVKKSSYSISFKAVKSQSVLLKTNCMGYKKTPKAQRKQSFSYKHYSKNSKYFECDKLVGIKTACAQLYSSKNLKNEHVHSFSKFRRHFYRVNRQLIRSCLKDNVDVEIINIRLASVNKTVENNFMIRLTENKNYFPHLVYHGTKLQNIKSILRYGFLIPNRAHPSNSTAPIIQSENGQAYGIGIYCSRTTTYSLSYATATNTLLVCAAIPHSVIKLEMFNILIAIS